MKHTSFKLMLISAIVVSHTVSYAQPPLSKELADLTQLSAGHSSPPLASPPSGLQGLSPIPPQGQLGVEVPSLDPESVSHHSPAPDGEIPNAASSLYGSGAPQGDEIESDGGPDDHDATFHSSVGEPSAPTSVIHASQAPAQFDYANSFSTWTINHPDNSLPGSPSVLAGLKEVGPTDPQEFLALTEDLSGSGSQTPLALAEADTHPAEGASPTHNAPADAQAASDSTVVPKEAGEENRPASVVVHEGETLTSDSQGTAGTNSGTAGEPDEDKEEGDDQIDSDSKNDVFTTEVNQVTLQQQLVQAFSSTWARAALVLFLSIVFLNSFPEKR
jgi:hypothetical protein